MKTPTNPQSKSFNWLFWLLVAVFIAQIVWMGIKLPTYLRMLEYNTYYPWLSLNQFFMLLVSAVFFIVRRPVGWFLISGLYGFTLLFYLYSTIFMILNNDPYNPYASQQVTSLVGWMSLVILFTVALAVALLHPRIRKDAFGISGRGIPLKIALAAATAGMVIWLLPWALNFL